MQSSRGVSRMAAALALGAIVVFSAPAGAQSWVNWQSFTNTGAAGTIPIGTGIGVTYAGERQGGSTLSTGSSAGSYFDPVAFPGTYTSAAAPNGPTNNGYIQLVGPSTNNTLTFSTPIDRLYFAIMSLGAGGSSVSYTFNHAFSLLSQGPGTYSGCNSCLTVSNGGLTISGAEGDGVLQFNGPITSLSFNVVGSENFHGFTIGAGVNTNVTPTPEPASLVLLGSGLLAIAGVARRRR